MLNNDIVPGFDDIKDESLEIKLHKTDDSYNSLKLTLMGYINTYNSSLFQGRVQKAIDAGYKNLVFQCGGMNYISSTGIGALAFLLKSLKSMGGSLVMLDVQPKVYEVFHILGFSQIFDIRDSKNI